MRSLNQRDLGEKSNAEVIKETFLENYNYIQDELLQPV
jgi:hypothetical protein